MKKSFVQSMTWLHSWGGLIFGWLLFTMFLCGSLTIFDKEITQWARPEVAPLAAADTADAADAASKYLQDQGLMDRAMSAAARKMPHADAKDMPKAPQAAQKQSHSRRREGQRWLVSLPGPRTPELRVAVAGPRRDGVLIDQHSGAPLQVRETQGGLFFFRFHYTFFAGRTGEWFAGAAAMAMLAAIISGVIIHFKRLLKDIFTFRPAASQQRSWLDAHTAGAVLALPFYLMVAYSGLLILFVQLMPTGILALYPGQAQVFSAEAGLGPFARPLTGEPAPLLPLGTFVRKAEEQLGKGQAGFISVLNPGDKAQTVDVYRYDSDRVAWSRDRISFDGTTGDVLNEQIMHGAVATTAHTIWGLHYGQYGGIAMHWLYFLSGLTGCGMIASGLVLFTVKRRQRHEADPVAHALFRAAERLNITFIAGISIACAAFLWGNRLLPAAMADRDQIEVEIFFSAWVLCLIHPLLRSPRRAWIEQLSLLAGLLLLLPVLNMATTQTGLTHSLSSADGGRDWVRAGVDLTAAALGLALAYAVRRIAVHRPETARRSRSPVTA